MEGVVDILTGLPATELGHDGHFIETESIDAIFVVTGDGVIDQELADPLVAVGENEAAGPALVGEVEAVVIICVGHPIVEENGEVVVGEAAGMIVNDIEQDSDAEGVAEIDEGAQLVVRAGDGFDIGITRLAAIDEQSINFGEITLEVGWVLQTVLVFRTEIIGAVIA